MASTELIVDDEYCKKMGAYFWTQGEQLDKCFNNYLNIIQQVQSSAVVSGETSNALAAYVSKAFLIKGQISIISQSAKELAEDFVTRVDAEDKYLF